MTAETGRRRGRPPIVLTGLPFGRLRVIGPAPSEQGKPPAWECKCDPRLGGCGGMVVASGVNLRAGKVQSCGCLRRDVARSQVRRAQQRRRSADEWRQSVATNLASLNEIIAELTAAVTDDAEFAAMVRKQLAEHSWALGFEFQGERAPADWRPSWSQ